VLDWRITDAGACLVTRAVPGVPADRLEPDALRRAWPAITDAVRGLHDIPAARCPFDRGLATMVPLARATVTENRVRLEFLPEELRHTPPTLILGQLEAELSERLAQESDEQVVCHGDLCLPNILINPDTLQVTGLIDLGRLGRADPYADIALLLANAREAWPDEHAARRADLRFAQRYGIDLDLDRQRFYLRLDPLTW
jgi:streptomycin 3"-kinase